MIAPRPKSAQQALIECGYAISEDELTSQHFGPSTIIALRAFQAAHVGPDGHALTEDGLLGPQSLWALDHPGAGTHYCAPGWRCMPTDARGQLVPILQWAMGRIGEHEIPDGSNRGVEIDKWTGMVGQPSDVVGPPWCAYFVSAAFGVAEGGSPFGILASAWKLRQWAVEGNFIHPTADARAGDLFTIMRGDGHGHVGIIGARLDPERVATVEGNASNAVKGLVREHVTFTCIVRPIPLP